MNATAGPMQLWQRLKSRAGVLLKYPGISHLRGVPMPHATGEAAQRAIARCVTVGGGSLVARIGMTEGRSTAHFLRHRLACGPVRASYTREMQVDLKFKSGFFPSDDASIDLLSELYVRSAAAIDIHAVWTPFDKLVGPSAAFRIRLVDLDPFFTRQRWTLALEGKRVCVVSPFAETMRTQYTRRNQCFPSPVLPDMDLRFVLAPMTLCDVDTTGQDWFANLGSMQDAIAAVQPDVVVIGAGAYGLPLGAFAKKQGLVAIVLGGSVQLLFGIRGSRWDNDPQYRRLCNDHWVRPSPMERPRGYETHEIPGGAYW